MARVDADYHGNYKNVDMTFPTLENGKEYTIFLVKKLNPRPGTILISRDQVIASGSYNNEDMDVSSEYEVETEVTDLESMVNLSSFETKIYEWTLPYECAQHAGGKA